MTAEKKNPILFHQFCCNYRIFCGHNPSLNAAKIMSRLPWSLKCYSLNVSNYCGEKSMKQLLKGHGAVQQ